MRAAIDFFSTSLFADPILIRYEVCPIIFLRDDFLSACLNWLASSLEIFLPSQDLLFFVKICIVVQLIDSARSIALCNPPEIDMCAPSSMLLLGCFFMIFFQKAAGEKRFNVKLLHEY